MDIEKNFTLKAYKKIIDLDVNVSFCLNDDNIFVTYIVSGEINDLLIPSEKNNPRRMYDLWEHTCFELFIKKTTCPWYIEFNFSPSKDWNCFYMSSYRDHVGEFEEIKEVNLQTQITSKQLIIKFNTSFKELNIFKAEDFLTNSIEISISSVLETKKSNELQYLALTHPESGPDFHASFIKAFAKIN